MKMQEEFALLLKSRLRLARKKAGLSLTEIARISRVHSSQVSRICRGEFTTVSANVVQVCKALGLPVEEVALPIESSLEQQLQSGIVELWDKTPNDAKRLMKLLKNLSELRKPTS